MCIKFNTRNLLEMQSFMLAFVYYCIDDIHYEFQSNLRIDFFYFEMHEFLFFIKLHKYDELFKLHTTSRKETNLLNIFHFIAQIRLSWELLATEKVP